MYQNLQLLRFAAAFCVLLFHLNLFGSGYKGVDLFFVISGFVMHHCLFSRRRPPAQQFLLHRFTKIFLLYWIALSCYILLSPASLKTLELTTVFLVPGHASTLGVSWSLSYELYFYVLVAAITYGINRRYHHILFVLLFTATTTITILNLGSFSLKGSIASFLAGANCWQFLLGILCGRIVDRMHHRISRRQSRVGLLLAVPAFLLISIPYQHPASFLVYGFLSFCIVLLLTSYERKKMPGPGIAPFFQRLGDASYAIYLIGPVVSLLLPANGIIDKIFVMVATLTLSLLVNRYMELPLLARLRTFMAGWNPLFLIDRSSTTPKKSRSRPVAR